MKLVLKSDSKPRLKWNPNLHQTFVEAVNHLGGVHKATPKSLLRVMGITGLTLYHLKSHLQKYRLGKSLQSENNFQLKNKEIEKKDLNLNEENINGRQDLNMNESIKMSKVLQIQMLVEKKLNEQIEVQKHLQLRIEAQSKYLQRVLRNAQDTISGFGFCSEALEQARAELSQLTSMVNFECQSSSLSELTESTELNFNEVEKDETEITTMKKRKVKEQEQSSYVFEEDCKRLKHHRSDEDQQKFKIVSLNDTEIGTRSQLIEFL